MPNPHLTEEELDALISIEQYTQTQPAAADIAKQHAPSESPATSLRRRHRPIHTEADELQSIAARQASPFTMIHSASHLGEDLLCALFSYLDLHSLAAMRRVNKLCHQHTKHAEAYQQQLHLDITSTHSSIDEMVERIYNSFPFMTSLSMTDATATTGDSLTLDGLRYLRRLYWLETLYLGQCNTLPDSTYALFDTLKHLRHLQLESSVITDVGIKHLAQCVGSTLESLNLTKCKSLNQFAVQALTTHCTALTSLQLGHCHKLGDSSVQRIGSTPQLQQQLNTLSIACCSKMTDAVVPHLQKLKALTALNTSGLKLTSKAIQQLLHSQTAGRLQTLYLSNLSAMSDELLLSHMVGNGALSQLQYLDLRGCKLSYDTIAQARSQLQTTHKQLRVVFPVVYAYTSTQTATAESLSNDVHELSLSTASTASVDDTSDDEWQLID